MIQLYINNQLCESPNLGKEKIAHSRQVNDIADMSNRKSNFTNQFKLPRTAINRAIFENAEQISSTTNIPYQKLNARLVEDGIEIISSGYATLQKSDIYYNIVIYSGNADFFTQLNGLKLSDLDLSQYDHIWNLANVVASFNNTSGMIYPIIDYSDDQSAIDNINKKADVHFLFPGMYAHTLFEKIVAQTNYKLSGKILSKSKYLKRLIPFALSGGSYNSNFIKNNTFSVQAIAQPEQTNTSISFNPIFTENVSNPNLPNTVQNNINNTQNTATLYNNTTGKFIVQNAGNYYLDAQMVINIANCIPVPIFGNVIHSEVTILKNGVALQTTSFDNFGNTNNPVIPYQTILNTIANVFLNKGDVITVLFSSNNLHGSSIINVLSFGQGANTANSDYAYLRGIFIGGLTYGNYITMSATLPDIAQVDFIKDLFQQLCIIPDADNITATLNLYEFDELYDNIPDAIDMTDKLDMSQPPTLTYIYNGYAQKNTCMYLDDVTVQTTALGEGNFFVNNQNLASEQIFIKLLFAACEDVNRLQGYSICNIPMLHGGVFKNTVKPKIVMVNMTQLSLSPSQEIQFTDGAATNYVSLVPLTYFSDATQTDSLDWESLLADNYDKLIVMLNQLKIVNAKFKLTSRDMNNFSHFVPWYLKQYSQYFYVNLIDSYQREKLTAITLIRM